MIAKALGQFGKASDCQIACRCLHAGFNRFAGQDDIEAGMIAGMRQDGLQQERMHHTRQGDVMIVGKFQPQGCCALHRQVFDKRCEVEDGMRLRYSGAAHTPRLTTGEYEVNSCYGFLSQHPSCATISPCRTVVIT